MFNALDSRARGVSVATRITLAIIVFLTFFEFITRLYVGLTDLPVHELQLNISQGAYAPHPEIGYIPRPGYHKNGFTINSQGYRGPEISQPKAPGTIRIVMLGGSTTMSIRADDDNTYPRLLEAMLLAETPQIEVINAGVGAYTSRETLLNFQYRVLVT